MKLLSKDRIFIMFCFLLAIGLRISYLLTPALDSDFAIVGLAARHILKGEFPLFFYGGYFEGIIEGYLAAPLFWLFGSSRFVLNCVPAIISLILIYVIYKLALIIYGKETAKLALLFSSVTSPYINFMFTVPMEGYIECTILGAVAFIITYKIIYQQKKLYRLYFLLGLISGFAFYLQFHIVPFILTIGLLLFLNDKKIFFRKYFLLLIIGFLLGNSPLLIYNITHKFVTFRTNVVPINIKTLWGTLKHMFGYGYWVILGARAEYAPFNYVPYLSSLMLYIYLLSFIYLLIRRKPGSLIIITFLIIFPVTYWLSGRGEINTRRYLIPLYAVTPIVLAYGINGIRSKSRFLFYSLIIFIVCHNLYTNFISITYFNPKSRKDYHLELLQDRQLYDFLKERNIKGAYTLSWWVSYRLNFDFNEEIIFALLEGEPYHKYLKTVDSQLNPAVVTYYSEFNQTLDSIGGEYKTHVVVPPQCGINPYSVQYDFKPANQILEEIDNSKWVVDSSHNQKTVGLAFDRDIATRWHSDTAQRKDMSFTIDLGDSYTNVTRLCYLPGPATDWPCGYELFGSVDGKDWKCISKNHGFIMPTFWDGPHPFFRTVNGIIEIDFQPETMRYLKLILTEDKNPWYWSITELFIYRQKETLKNPQEWNVDKLIERILQIKPKRIYADPWVTSYIDLKFYFNNDTIDNNYIYVYSIVNLNRLSDYIFIVLNENYPSFTKQIEGFKFNTEEFGPYKLIIFDNNTDTAEKLYWDGFHLLKVSYDEKK